MANKKIANKKMANKKMANKKISGSREVKFFLGMISRQNSLVVSA